MTETDIDMVIAHIVLYKLAENRNLSPNIILKYLIVDDARVNLRISRHKCVTMAFYQRYPTIKWNVKALAMNPNIGPYIIDQPNFSWENFSLNPALTITMMEQYADKLVYPLLSYNNNLTWAFIAKYSHKDWNWRLLSRHKCVTPTIIDSNSHINWSLEALCFNPNITWSYITAKLKRCRWRLLSKHKCLTWDIIVQYPTLWDWYDIFLNPNITLGIILQHPHYKWNWYYVSQNPNITDAVVRANPTVNWDLDGLIINDNISWAVILQHPHFTTCNKHHLGSKPLVITTLRSICCNIILQRQPAITALPLHLQHEFNTV